MRRYEIKKFIVNLLEDILHLSNPYGGDVAGLLVDYQYVCGGISAKCARALTQLGVFDAIGIVVGYEQGNFCRVCTDLTKPADVANTVVCILVRELLAKEPQNAVLMNAWNRRMRDDELVELYRAVHKYMRENKDWFEDLWDECKSRHVP